MPNAYAGERDEAVLTAVISVVCQDNRAMEIFQPNIRPAARRPRWRVIIAVDEDCLFQIRCTHFASIGASTGDADIQK